MRKIEFTLGLIVLFSVFSFSFVMWKSWKDSGESYQLRVSFLNAGGISAGDPVKISGVRVGRVQEVSLDQESYRAVVHLSILKKVSLPVDTEVSVVSSGFLSGQYLRLIPGEASTFLGSGGVLKNIREYKSLEEQVAGTVASMFGN